MKPSKFWDGMKQEQYSFIVGINETVEDKSLIRPHSRYILPSTDYADGISFRKFGLSTDGLGYARLPYNGTGLYSGFARGMGIFQLQGSASNFTTYFTKIFPVYGAGPYPAQSASSWDQWAFSSSTATNIATYNGRSSSPVGIQLPCKVYENGVDVLTDFMQLVGAWNISNTTTSAPLIQQGIAPTLPSTTGTGLTGYYAWCYTFVDANGNESQPSPLVASGNLSNVGQNVTVTPTGITQSVWTTIRLYRTITNTVAVTAAQNPTFFHVPGLDITVTGAGSYTVTDNIPDTTLQLSYQMTNVNYFGGVLASLDVTAIPKFLVGWNNALWGGFWNISGVDNPITVYYSASVDNSQTSTGNCTSWNNLNFIDIGTLEDGKIIGMYPGLQGRLYVFKEFSTYLIQPTGNTLLPYSSTPISGDFGLYHHSIAEVGGAVIGRAGDGVYQFNGSSFKALAHPIYQTMNNLIQPEADSGVYDKVKQRYYLSVCDSQITNSFNTQVPYGVSPTVAISIINCFRNTVLIFDMNTGSWETHRSEPIQIFGKLKDSGGREKIFALGISGDVFVLLDGNCFGSSFGFWGTPQPGFGNNVLLGPVMSSNKSFSPVPNSFIPISISTDGNIQFMDWQSVCTSVTSPPRGSPQLFSFNNPLPINDSTVTVICVLQNNSDVVSNFSGGDITVSENFFLDAGTNNYSIYDVTSSNLYMWNDGGLSVSSDTILAPINEAFSPSPAINDSILILPTRFFPNYAYSGNSLFAVPRHVFMTPPFGTRENDNVQKMFQELRMHVKGSGTVYVWGFKNGNESYQLGPAGAIPDEKHSFVLNSNTATTTTRNGVAYPDFYQQIVHLNGIVSYYERFMVWMYRGSGWFEIQDFICYHRLMQQLDDF